MCHGFSREEIVKWLNLVKTQTGNHDGTRLRKLWHTDHPSIQGPWTPYTFREPSLNIVEFPNEELSKPLNQPISASEQLLEIFKKQQNIQSLEDKSTV